MNPESVSEIYDTDAGCEQAFQENWRQRALAAEELLATVESENAGLRRALQEEKDSPSDLAYELHFFMTKQLHAVLAEIVEDELIAFTVMSAWAHHAPDMPRLIDKELAKWPDLRP